MNKAKQKNKIVKVFINNIKIVDFILDSSRYTGPKKINRDHFYFNLRGANKVKMSSNSIFILTIGEIIFHKEKSKTDPIEICKIKIEIEFKFENLSKIITFLNGKAQIPQELLQKMLNTSFSTTRGILFTKLSGTVFEKIYLPPIDPISFNQSTKK